MGLFGFITNLFTNDDDYDPRLDEDSPHFDPHYETFGYTKDEYEHKETYCRCIKRRKGVNEWDECNQCGNKTWLI